MEPCTCAAARRRRPPLDRQRTDLIGAGATLEQLNRMRPGEIALAWWQLRQRVERSRMWIR